MRTSAFTRNLLRWNATINSRQMPWKNEKDPYRIWLSEVILQQTRVEQGWAYYERFLKAFPTIRDLAKAPPNRVMKLWEGLGYYSRCRNLMETARVIVKDHGGRFPESFDAISALKGIGPYTASAIASFAFKLPHPVVDGNVYRILARYFGLSTLSETAAEKKFYYQLAASLLDKKEPGVYNQAIMDFGATVCKPKNPLCSSCVQASECMAFQNGWVDLLPVKKKKPIRRTRWFCYLVIETRDGRIYVRQRIGKDIWHKLYEFVLVELDEPPGNALASIVQQALGREPYEIIKRSGPYQQQLTHQTIQATFISLRIEKPLTNLTGYRLVKKSQLKQFPFPRVINHYLDS